MSTWSRRAIVAGLGGCLVGCPSRTRPVILYASVDRDVAERLLAHSPQRVAAVYDGEANKTAGLVQRLMAERRAPRAHLFWNGEVVRTIQLADIGVLGAAPWGSGPRLVEGLDDPGRRWFGFAGRLRVLLAQTDRLPLPLTAMGVESLTDPALRGLAAVANPRFGTTGTHFAALLVQWGRPRFVAWLRALSANGVRVLPGNAQVRDAVIRGDVVVGLTDSDDALSAVRAGHTVSIGIPDQTSKLGALLIPNTVAWVSSGPDASTSEPVFDYLLSASVEAALAASRSGNYPLRHALPGTSTLPPLSGVRRMVVDFASAAGVWAEMQRLVAEELLAP